MPKQKPQNVSTITCELLEMSMDQKPFNLSMLKSIFNQK